LAKSSSTEAQRKRELEIKTNTTEKMPVPVRPQRLHQSKTRKLSSSSSDDYSYRSVPTRRQMMPKLTRGSSDENTERASDDKENSGVDDKESSRAIEQREITKKKMSRKNSSLLDMILLNNTSQEKRVGENEMFYHEPSVNYLGTFE